MRKAIVIILAIWAVTLRGQDGRFRESTHFCFTAAAQTGTGKHAPFWFTSNRYGLGTSQRNAGLLRTMMHRTIEADSLRHWKVGYGIDIASPINRQNGYIALQQAFFDVQWHTFRLSLGQKERPSELKNARLSSGGMTLGTNARPLPQVRLELPDFWTIPGTKNWIGIKAHIAYGWFTDNAWQRHFNAGDNTQIFSTCSKFHSKALLFRLGNHDKMPITLTGGLEMACQFGGTIHNLRRYTKEGILFENEKIPTCVTEYWHALTYGGSDRTDGDFSNVAGNHVGSWHTRLDYEGKGWRASAYLEHFFEDHSQLFWQYGWKDMLLGMEVALPKNPFLSAFVYEYIGTMDQSGPVYHDATPNIPKQVSAIDNYYSHNLYGSWQHAGFLTGNPTLISPLYNTDHSLEILFSRNRTHHLGLAGMPHREIAWRVLYTHIMSHGTYKNPTIDPRHANFLLVEAIYSPRQLQGIDITLSYGHNDGDIIGKANAGMVSIKYSI